MNFLTSAAHWVTANIHLHLLFYTAIALLLLYRPPAVMQRLQGIGDFVSRHWGDSIGLYMIHLGIVLTVVGGFYTQLGSVQHVGESFILTGVGMLKLKYIPKEGNGNGGDGANGTPAPAPAAPAPVAPAPVVPTVTLGGTPGTAIGFVQKTIGHVGDRGDHGDLGTNNTAKL